MWVLESRWIQPISSPSALPSRQAHFASFSFLRIPTLSQRRLARGLEGGAVSSRFSHSPFRLKQWASAVASSHRWLESLKTPSGLFYSIWAWRLSFLTLEIALSAFSLEAGFLSQVFLSGSLLWSLRGFSLPCVLHLNRW